MWDLSKVRIVDIAEELGVSTATVSNVLHGKTKKISDATVRRVERKLEERGYIPNMAATLLARNDSRIIGVVAKDHEKYEGRLLEDPFISASLNDLADEIEGRGYFMMLKKASAVMDIVRFASMWNLDGMVVMCFCADEYQ
ncbi:MAG: LacI family DNA-binding transcriptional regulator, partial [Clostridia bacterium]|nr:LacI family DNA-binding transcriptional regulator [Clostridia bacterium]